MLKVDVYTLKGTKQTKELVLPKEVEVKDNPALLAQAVHVYRHRGHIGLAKAKTRAEVDRTTKKVYKQKGTGGARHGSKKAPIYVGGGIAHGPKALKRLVTLPEKMRKQALNVALNLKAKAGDIVAVEGLAKVTKTKEANDFLKKLNIAGKKVIALATENGKAKKVLGNLKDTKVVSYKDLNAYDLVTSGKLILDVEVFGKPVVKPTPATKAAKPTVKKETTKK